MMPVVFDANVLIDLFSERTKGDRRAKLDALVKHYDRSRIIIPTPSLTEYLVRAGKARDELMAKLSANRHFTIQAFDQRAATECALLLEEAWNKDARAKVSRTKFKFDWQIVAIARSHNATVIYSDDADIHRYGKAADLKVISIEQLPLPDAARQRKLDLDKPK